MSGEGVLINLKLNVLIIIIGICLLVIGNIYIILYQYRYWN